MAEGGFTSSAQHLTSLDFDLSPMYESLNLAQDLIAQTVQEIQTNERYKIRLDLSVATEGAAATLKGVNTEINTVTNNVSNIGTATKQSLDFADTELKKYQDMLKETAGFQQDFSNIQFEREYTVGDNGEQQLQNVKATVTYTNELNQSMQKTYALNASMDAFYERRIKDVENIEKQTQQYNKTLATQENQVVNIVNSLEKQLRTIQAQPSTIDYSVNTQAAETQLQSLNALLVQLRSGEILSDEQVKNVSQASTNTKLLNENLQRRILQENQLTAAIEKQEKAIAKAEAVKNPNIENQKILAEMEANLGNIQGLQDKISKTGLLSRDDLTQLDGYTQKTNSLNAELTETNKRANNMLQTITDKARWLSAFYLIQMIERGFRETVETIIEVEDAVVELQRVLNEDIGDVEIQGALLGVAEEYGRVFSEVSDTAVKFAQTGATWNETLALTEATMLAVNTAELEVESATTGLIAVIAQFNLEASNMVEIVDKINITADNFAVTSENIVAALQRAGSSAVAANMSLEETIAIITSLSEATGRSGESIGTAINSLIAYTSRAESLDVFADLGSNMEAVVERYRMGAAQVSDIWLELSRTISAMSEEQTIALAQALEADDAYQGFASQLETDATELTEQIQATYETAGMHRRNYFIALLSNMDGYTDALSNMSDAEGYSLQENEKYMDTLTAQMNQLKTAAQELAVAFGEDGFLLFLKWMVSAGVAIIDVVSALGGMKSVLIAVMSVFIALKAQSVTDFFTAMGTAVSNAKNQLVSLATGATSASVATKTLTTSIQTLSLVSGSVLVLFSLVSSAVTKYKQSLEEAEAQARNLREEYARNTEALKDYKAELTTLYSNRNAENQVEINKQILVLQERITDAIGNQATGLDLVNGNQQEVLDKLDEEYSKRVRNNLQNLEAAKLVAEQEAQMPTFETSIFDTFMRDWSGVTAQIQAATYDTGDALRLSLNNTISNLEPEEQIKRLTELRDALITQQNEINEAIATGAVLPAATPTDYSDSLTLVNGLLAEAEEKQSALTEATKAWTDGIKAIGEVSLFENFNLDLVETQEDFDEVIERINALNQTDLSGLDLDNINIGLEELKTLLIEVAREQTGFAEDLEINLNTLSYAFQDNSETIEGLLDQIDNAVSSFSTMYDAMEQYNETGYLSIDMVQQLLALDTEYFNSLKITADGIFLVDQQTGELVNSKQDLIKQLIVEQGAHGLNAIAQKYATQAMEESEVATGSAKYATEQYEATLQNFVYRVLNSAGTVSVYRSELQKLAGEAGVKSDQLNGFMQEATTYLSNLQSLYGGLNNYAGDFVSIAGRTTDEIQKQNDALKEQQEIIKENYEKQIDALEAQKDSIDDYYQKQIDGLKDVEKENDRIRAKEEYYDRLAEARQDLAEAEARSGVEYREAEQDARDEISDIEMDWQDQLEDWDIEDEISRLEELRDAAIDNIESQIETVREKMELLEEEMSEATSGSNSERLEGFANDYIIPAEEMQLASNEKVFAIMASQASETAPQLLETMTQGFLMPLESHWSRMFDDMVVEADRASRDIYDVFSVNYLARMQQDMAAATDVSSLEKFYANQQNGFQMPTSSYSTTNNSKSFNVYANNQTNNSLNRAVNTGLNFLNMPY